MCCKCYVEAGNPPADWHQECMVTKYGNTYEKLEFNGLTVVPVRVTVK